MIGDQVAQEIIFDICRSNKVLSRRQAVGVFNELKRCKYIKVHDTNVVNIKQIPYE
jgi:hypothetical protein